MEKLLNLNNTISKDLFDSVEYPWDVLPNIKNYILEVIPTLGDEYIKLKERRQILVEEHKKIIHSLARRDADAAAEAINTHIAHQEQYVMSVIQSNK